MNRGNNPSNNAPNGRFGRHWEENVFRHNDDRPRNEHWRGGGRGGRGNGGRIPGRDWENQEWRTYYDGRRDGGGRTMYPEEYWKGEETTKLKSRGGTNGEENKNGKDDNEEDKDAIIARLRKQIADWDKGSQLSTTPNSGLEPKGDVDTYTAPERDIQTAVCSKCNEPQTPMFTFENCSGSTTPISGFEPKGDVDTYTAPERDTSVCSKCNEPQTPMFTVENCSGRCFCPNFCQSKVDSWPAKSISNIFLPQFFHVREKTATTFD
jgi:hypothetical protein